jgi:hypothetical protein
MAKKSRPSVLKRAREAKKAEKAMLKRERRVRLSEPGSQVPGADVVNINDEANGFPADSRDPWPVVAIPGTKQHESG